MEASCMIRVFERQRKKKWWLSWSYIQWYDRWQYNNMKESRNIAVLEKINLKEEKFLKNEF